jgi:hypothetical protein
MGSKRGRPRGPSFAKPADRPLISTANSSRTSSSGRRVRPSSARAQNPNGPEVDAQLRSAGAADGRRRCSLPTTTAPDGWQVPAAAPRRKVRLDYANATPRIASALKTSAPPWCPSKGVLMTTPECGPRDSRDRRSRPAVKARGQGTADPGAGLASPRNSRYPAANQYLCRIAPSHAAVVVPFVPMQDPHRCGDRAAAEGPKPGSWGSWPAGEHLLCSSL